MSFDPDRGDKNCFHGKNTQRADASQTAPGNTLPGGYTRRRFFHYRSAPGCPIISPSGCASAKSAKESLHGIRRHRIETQVAARTPRGAAGGGIDR
jgi:hypothetical protein